MSITVLLLLQNMNQRLMMRSLEWRKFIKPWSVSAQPQPLSVVDEEELEHGPEYKAWEEGGVDRFAKRGPGHLHGQ